MGFLAWLKASRIGAFLIAAAAIAVAVAVAFLKAFNAGKAAERAKQTQDSLKNLRNRTKTDEEVRNLDDAARRRRLNRWVRD